MTTAASADATESVNIAGETIHYTRKGSGSPLVVLHHSISNHGWLPFHDRLAERFEVYMPDLPGFGESERPSWARNVRDIAIQTELWMDAVGLDRVTLVGFGFGGWVAAEMATMNQGRLDRLVLVGAAGIQPREGEIVDQLVVDYIDYVRLGFEDEAAFTKYFGEDPPRETRVLLYGGREMTMRVTFKPWMFNRALPILLRAVHVPALVIWGDHDQIVPLDVGKQFAEALPNAELLVLNAAGHFLEFERPEPLVDAIFAAKVAVAAQ